MDVPSVKKWYSLCTPSQVYLVVSVILMVVTTVMGKPSIRYVVIHVLYIMFWTLLLSFICYLGYPSVSWFILLLPFIIIAAAIVYIFASSVVKS